MCKITFFNLHGRHHTLFWVFIVGCHNQWCIAVSKTWGLPRLGNIFGRMIVSFRLRLIGQSLGIIAVMLLILASPVAVLAKESASPKTSTSTKTQTATKTTTSSSASKKPTTKTKTAKKTTKSKKTSVASAEKKDQFSALVVNAQTGEVLYEKNAGALRYPASLTKMMTLYMTFDALKRGILSMGQTMPVSSKAAAQPQTNISLKPGERLPVKSAIESLVVRSANDSAMVLAEALGGTEFNFALAMTQKARELGMKNTVFRNPNGLPDDKQVTTAYDMARLGMALRRDFPEYYSFFKLTSFTYNGVNYPGHNRVMEKYPGADGIKTGYIRASGYNLVTSVQRDGYSLVAVVMGGTTASERDKKMMALLDDTFKSFSSPDNSVAGTSKIPGEGASVVRAESVGLLSPSMGQGDCHGAACR